MLAAVMITRWAMEDLNPAQQLQLLNFIHWLKTLRGIMIVIIIIIIIASSFVQMIYWHSLYFNKRWWLLKSDEILNSNIQRGVVEIYEHPFIVWWSQLSDKTAAHLHWFPHYLTVISQLYDALKRQWPCSVTLKFKWSSLSTHLNIPLTLLRVKNHIWSLHWSWFGADNHWITKH